LSYAEYDAIIIGSGPNGLSAAITLALTGHSVLVYEAAEVIGHGARTAEVTLPGFMHDVCSGVHPMAAGSPFFRTLPLAQYGLEWIQPPPHWRIPSMTVVVRQNSISLLILTDNI
jgi:phytoene dehydrogenase-like protein